MRALSAALACGLAAALAQGETNPGVAPILLYSVVADGSSSVPAATRGLHVSARVQRLEIRFGPNPAASPPPVRLRYQLEGFDKEWREAGGEMRLNARFLDTAGKTVSAQDFVARGESVGWAGAVARSRFARRTEQIRVPNRAASLQLELFSGGSEQTVGVMVIDHLTVSVSAGAGGNAEALLFSSQSAADQPPNTRPGWMRDGSKPSVAQMLSSDESQPRQVLAVVDTDPSAWGAWRTDPDGSISVKENDTLFLRWNEMYSIGWGGGGQAEYSYLPPGRYRFQVQAVTENGESTGAILSIPLVVDPLLWQRPWFRGCVLAGLVVALAAAVRYATRRKMQAQLELAERQRAVALERTRIARDIHDDLGANLTQIALLSELAQTDFDQPAQAKAHLAQIFTTAGAVARQLDEIVWAITPSNDTLEQFVSYFCKFAQDYLRLAGIRCRLEVPESLPNCPMSSAQRHDLFLAAKEALHNVVKHAHAEEVWLRLRIAGKSLVLTIEDNGTGLGDGAGSRARGHGLANMQNRMQHAGGTFAQSSESGRGATVRLALPLQIAAVHGRVGSSADL